MAMNVIEALENALLTGDENSVIENIIGLGQMVKATPSSILVHMEPACISAGFDGSKNEINASLIINGNEEEMLITPFYGNWIAQFMGRKVVFEKGSTTQVDASPGLQTCVRFIITHDESVFNLNKVVVRYLNRDFNIQSYYNRCVYFDTYFRYSDDGNVYNNALKEELFLQAVADKLGGDWKKIHTSVMAKKSKNEAVPKFHEIVLDANIPRKLPFLYWNVTTKKFVAFYGNYGFGNTDTGWMADTRLPPNNEVVIANLDICSAEDTAEFDSEIEAVNWLMDKIKAS